MVHGYALVSPLSHAGMSPARNFRKVDHHETLGIISLMNAKTGDYIAKMPMEILRRVVRGKLRDLFRTSIDIVFGMNLTSMKVDSTSAAVIFNNGEREEQGILILGADGG
jgi:2-polyprenyl-6-methoxyphenol hydroxylase-like FAD-dependent oxidoreductase